MKDIMNVEKAKVMRELVDKGYVALTEDGKTAYEVAIAVDECKKDVEQATIKAVKERLTKYWKETFAQYSTVTAEGTTIDFPYLLGDHIVKAIIDGTIDKVVEGDENVLSD